MTQATGEEREGEGRRGGGKGGLLNIMHGHSRMIHRPSHLYNAGTKYVGFSPAKQTLLAPSARRREVSAGGTEGELIIACEADLHMEDSFNELIEFRSVATPRDSYGGALQLLLRCRGASDATAIPTTTQQSTKQHC